MKKLAILGSILAVVVLIVTAMPALAAQPAGNGFDEYGYNYQARIFNGLLGNSDENRPGGDGDPDTLFGDANDVTPIDSVDYVVPVAGTHLVMKWDQKWNDAVFGPDGIRMNGDELAWQNGAWVTNHDTWTDADGTHTAYYKIEYVGPGNGGVHFAAWGDAYEITSAVYDAQKII